MTIAVPDVRVVCRVEAKTGSLILRAGGGCNINAIGNVPTLHVLPFTLQMLLCK